MAKTLEYAPGDLGPPRPPRLLVWNTLLLLAVSIAWLPTTAIAALDVSETLPQIIGVLFTLWMPVLIIGFAAWHSVFRSSRASTGFAMGAYLVVFALLFAAGIAFLDAFRFGGGLEALAMSAAAGVAAAYFGVNAWLSWRWFRALPP